MPPRKLIKRTISKIKTLAIGSNWDFVSEGIARALRKYLFVFTGFYHHGDGAEVHLIAATFPRGCFVRVRLSTQATILAMRRFSIYS